VRERLSGAQTVGDDRGRDAGTRDDELGEGTARLDLRPPAVRPARGSTGRGVGETFRVALDALEREASSGRALSISRSTKRRALRTLWSGTSWRRRSAAST
jgi:hypothetical protein